MKSEEERKKQGRKAESEQGRIKVVQGVHSQSSVLSHLV